MLRTARTAVRTLRWKGPAWPFRLLAGMAACRIHRMPRSIMVEPTGGCTGSCEGCLRNDDPPVLQPSLMEEWLDSAPSRPVTVHFVGKHSDPLASPLLAQQVASAVARCSMTSVSTIGLGMTRALAALPVDRWIVSVPGATEVSWNALRNRDRFSDVIDAIDALSGSCSMVEVVLTLWKASRNDLGPFEELSAVHGWKNTQVVFGRYDPEGYSIGRIGNLALDHPDCPYGLSEEGIPFLKLEPPGCPLADCVFMSAEGVLLPCPFVTDGDHREIKPGAEAWKKVSAWKTVKNSRSFSACRFCP